MHTKWIYILLFSIFSPIYTSIFDNDYWRQQKAVVVPPTTATTEIATTIRTTTLPPPVLIKGYYVGLTLLALASGVSSDRGYLHLNPASAYFYTNAYRWGLRHLSLIPVWLAGHDGHYCDTLKLWRRRFYYLEEFVPKWMRYLLPHVRDSEWEKEIAEYKKFQKHSEPAFAKHYRYPSPNFTSWESEDASDSKSSSSAEAVAFTEAEAEAEIVESTTPMSESDVDDDKPIIYIPYRGKQGRN